MLRKIDYDLSDWESYTPVQRSEIKRVLSWQGLKLEPQDNVITTHEGLSASLKPFTINEKTDEQIIDKVNRIFDFVVDKWHLWAGGDEDDYTLTDEEYLDRHDLTRWNENIL